MTSLPEGAVGFTTAELKTNFVGSSEHELLLCTATRTHAGRSTQVWDATVTDGDGRALSLFRCTQLLLWSRLPSGQGQAGPGR
jgi:acyl-coenzyme A thioesterase PaaI-like protein